MRTRRGKRKVGKVLGAGYADGSWVLEAGRIR
jgi:hypothetical protein